MQCRQVRRVPDARRVVPFSVVPGGLVSDSLAHWFFSSNPGIMAALTEVIRNVEGAVGAIMRVKQTGTDATGQPQFQVGIVGTAFCVVRNRVFVTANHVFMDDKQP